jgi:endogenous inhibitor of DNA gyrase (YacG/DUF329 family)
VAYVVIALCFGLAGGLVGRAKGSSFLLWFVIAAVVPFVGLLAAVAHRVELDEPRRACPGCGKVVKLHDALCTRCGTELEWTDEVIPSETAMAAR